MTEIANNSQIEDLMSFENPQTIRFDGKLLELKYLLRTKEVLSSFIKSKERISGTIKKIKKEFGFESVFCRFDFGEYEPSEDLQKNLIDFQSSIFDLTSVQMIGNDFETFKRVFEYADSKDIEVSTLNDLKLESEMNIQILDYLKKQNLSHSRWLYHKITTCLENYKKVPEILKNSGIRIFVVGCPKRCGIKYSDCENLCASVVIRAGFGFDGCCRDFRHVVKDSNGRKIGFPSGGMDKFNMQTLEWEKVPNKEHRKSRMEDYFNISNIDVADKSVIGIPKLKTLLVHLGV